MIITTTPTIEGRPIKEYKGIVTGETIIGANFLKDFLAGIRDFIGGRSGSYEKVLREGKARHEILHGVLCLSTCCFFNHQSLLGETDAVLRYIHSQPRVNRL